MTDGGFGPGIGAFAVFFLLAIALWLLMRNMNARLRRMSYADRRAQREGSAVAGAGEPSTGESAARASSVKESGGQNSGEPDRDPVKGD